MKIGLVAGEKSGDYLGSELIKALKVRYPDAEFIGLCGPLMQAQGAVTLDDMDAISIFGLDGLFKALPRILAIRRKLFRHFVESPPDVFIGIDVPDFNLGLEKKLRANGIPTVHLVSPTVWAWRGGRIKKISQAVDLMLTLFPFEQDFYQQHEVPAKFVGHPLAKEIQGWQVDAQLQSQLLEEGKKLIALLPGSRSSEVTRLAEPMIEAAYQIDAERRGIKFVIPAANDKIFQYLTETLQVDTSKITVVNGHSRDILKLADIAVLASGTAALEAALFATPMVVMYKVAWLSAAVFGHTVTVEHFSMPNHLLSPPIVPELIQSEANAENCVAEVRKLLDDKAYYESMQNALASITPQLSVDTGTLASAAIIELLEVRSGA